MYFHLSVIIKEKIRSILARKFLSTLGKTDTAMQKFAFLLLLSSLFIAFTHAQTSRSPIPESELREPKMTQARMVEIVKELVEETEGPDNSLSFVYDGIAITMVSDVNANRMRLLAAVIDVEQLTEEQILATLVSNYHLALDARYAIGGNVLYSTYIHPLSPLTKDLSLIHI